MREITTYVDHDPGGMQMPSRYGGSTTYKFAGAGGQEKETEITNNNSHYSAEYWMYDSRLGRRWNQDPVVKPWRSPYDAFSNNPIIMIDPKGDDDFFDSQGRYLGSTKEGSTIRVVNSGVTFDAAKKDVMNTTKKLSEYTYKNTDYNNKYMLLNVSRYYGAKAGIKTTRLTMSTKENDGDGDIAAWWESGQGGYVIFRNSKGEISSTLDDANNFQSVAVHEKEHELNKKTHFNIDHIYAIVAATEHSSWDGTTTDFKKGQLRYAQDLLNTSIKDNKAKPEEIQKRIDDLNISKLGETGTLEYDKKTNSVKIGPPMQTLDGFTITVSK